MGETSLSPDDLLDFWTACGLPPQRWPEARRAYQRFGELIAAEQHVSLMGPQAQRTFFTKHVADSLAGLIALPRLLAGPVRLADVGSGAGLPAIVLAIALPELHAAAIESHLKKADFLASAARELGLGERFEVIPRHSREAARDERYAHRFDVVAARAVGPACRLVHDCRLLLAPGGTGLLYKTPVGVAQELELAQREAGKHGMDVRTSPIIRLPGAAGDRQFILVTAPA